MNRLLLLNIFLLAFVVAANEFVIGADGLAEGDAVGAFYVTKIAGAEGDGVKPGQELCYRCRYGSRPMVMIFARKTNAKLVEFVKKLDSAIADNEESRLRGLVTFIGEDVAEVKDGASEFAVTSGARHVPVAIAKETSTGPPNYKLDGSAVTILIAKDSQLVSMSRCDADKINVAALMSKVRQVLHSNRALKRSSRF